MSVVLWPAVSARYLLYLCPQMLVLQALLCLYKLSISGRFASFCSVFCIQCFAQNSVNCTEFL